MVYVGWRSRLCLPAATASVSLLHDGTPTTLAASHAQIGAFDRAQYGQGRGPCVDAMRRHEPVTVEDFRTDRAGRRAGRGRSAVEPVPAVGRRRPAPSAG